MQDVEKRVIGKVMWRLIPFLILCYFVAYLDRVDAVEKRVCRKQACWCGGVFTWSWPEVAAVRRTSRLDWPFTQSTRTPDLLAGRADAAPSFLGSARWRRGGTRHERRRDL